MVIGLVLITPLNSREMRHHFPVLFFAQKFSEGALVCFCLVWFLQYLYHRQNVSFSLVDSDFIVVN